MKSGQIQVWKSVNDKFQELKAIEYHRMPVTFIKFLSNGSELLAGCPNENKFTLWRYNSVSDTYELVTDTNSDFNIINANFNGEIVACTVQPFNCVFYAKRIDCTK